MQNHHYSTFFRKKEAYIRESMETKFKRKYYYRNTCIDMFLEGINPN